MKIVWLYDKLPDPNGYYVIEIQTRQGSRVSTFKAKTIPELTEKVAKSHMSAMGEMTRLKNAINLITQELSSTFKGRSIEELAEELAKSRIRAMREIERMNKTLGNILHALE